MDILTEYSTSQSLPVSSQPVCGGKGRLDQDVVLPYTPSFDKQQPSITNHQLPYMRMVHSNSVPYLIVDQKLLVTNHGGLSIWTSPQPTIPTITNQHTELPFTLPVVAGSNVDMTGKILYISKIVIPLSMVGCFLAVQIRTEQLPC